jgi:hypothetical protein
MLRVEAPATPAVWLKLRDAAPRPLRGGDEYRKASQACDPKSRSHVLFPPESTGTGLELGICAAGSRHVRA